MAGDHFSYILGTIRIFMDNPDDGGQTHLTEILMRPPPSSLLFRVTEPSFERQFTDISSLLSSRPDLHSLFHLYLITALVQTPEPVFRKTRHFLSTRLNFTGLLGFDPPPENPVPWCSVPVVVTESGRAHIRYFIMGKVISPAHENIMPAWAMPLLDPASLEAVRSAATAARTLFSRTAPARLFCYPLTQPAPLGNRHHPVRFQGKSLGLPLALGFAALLHGHTPPGNLAATGQITDQGNILPVTQLDLKKSGLEKTPFKALIHPANGTGFTPSTPLTCLPVSTLNQAYALFSLYSPDATENLMLLSACMNDPEVLAKNIGNLPCAWLEWITRHRLIQPALKTLHTAPHLFTACTRTFENKTKAFDIDHARAIQALVPEQAIDRLCPTATMPAFRWCTASLALANHCGNTVEARQWEQKGLGLAESILQADLNLLTDFYNHALVARHNQYLISPDLPPFLTELLAIREEQYLPQCTFGCPTEPVLGRLYGTLLQHFAFCGPEYLDRTQTFFHKAVQALGQDQVIEYRQEWLRQYNYLTYALLDAGDLNGARQSLITYFEHRDMNDLIANLRDPTTRLSPWQTALAARFFVQDTAHSAKEPIFKHLLHQYQSDATHAHPRQLTAFNLGRMALDLHDTTTGTTLLHQSITQCLSPHAGPTIQVMALLPISFMPDPALPAPPLLKTWKQSICSAAAHLNPAHFSSILEISLDAARQRIRQNPAAWFPFNYR